MLIDAGPLVALCNPDDDAHERCHAEVGAIRTPMLSCWPVVTEASYLLRANRGGTRRLLHLIRDGMVHLLPLGIQDLPGIERYLTTYADNGLQLADAALAHLADRGGHRAVFTLDRRDFAAIRLGDGSALTVIPEAA